MRSYRALFISDIHMSNKLPQAQLVADGMSDRLNDQMALWNRVHATAREYKPAATFVLGDLFDKSLVDAVTLTATTEAMMASPVPLFILPGNHDAVSTQGGRFTVEAFGKMGSKRVKYVGSNVLEPLELTPWLRFWPVEYSGKARAEATIGAIREKVSYKDAHGAPVDRRGVEVLLLHHSILGCKHLGWTCDDGLDADEVVDGFDHVFSGHFHETQKFGTDDKGMYLGAPMHHRMDDEGRSAGYWIVDFTPEGRTETFIDGGAPHMHSAVWPRAPVTTLKHKARPGDYLRVVVEATHAEWLTLRPAVMECVERMKARGIRATFKHRPIYHHEVRIASSVLGAKVSMDEMVSSYVDSADVETSGMNIESLKNIGRRALEEARRRT